MRDDADSLPSLTDYAEGNFASQDAQPEYAQDEDPIAAFSDLADDPMVQEVVPGIAERAQAAKTPSRPAPFRAYHPGSSVPIASPALPGAERVYVPAMGPRPHGGVMPGQTSLGLAPDAESTMAGLSLLVVGLAGAYGALSAGPRGGAIGVLAGGAGINALRASKANSAGLSKEALVSATFAVVGLGAAGWLWWGMKPKREKGEERE